MKKIGIVVPIYNAEPYLRQCVNSILRQTYTNLELMLVDDGSVDNSGKLCDEFARMDRRVHVIHQNNQGKLPARYNGLKNLECDYAAFVDADDWISEETYESMSRYMLQNIDIISFQIIRYFDDADQCISYDNYLEGLYDKNQIEEMIYPTMIWDISKEAFGLDPSLCNKIMKKELLLNELQNAKKLSISYGEDVAVTYPLMTQAQSFMITGKSLYYHRQRKQNDIAPYISDPHYYKKLYSLYEYLIEQLIRYPILKKQMDYFYTEAVRMHLRIYRDKRKRAGFLFPFDQVPVRSKIILYGASTLGQTFYEQIKQLQYCNVVAWVDKNYEAYTEFGVREVAYVKGLEDYDYIIIAVYNQEIAGNIRKDLISMGVRKDKIVCVERRKI